MLPSTNWTERMTLTYWKEQHLQRKCGTDGLIFLIAGLILLCGAIGQGLRLANRIAVASETSAIDSLPPI